MDKRAPNNASYYSHPDMSCHTKTRDYNLLGNTSSNVSICNNDLLYLADHCYNVIGDEKLKSICDRLLLSALGS